MTRLKKNLEKYMPQDLEQLSQVLQAILLCCFGQDKGAQERLRARCATIREEMVEAGWLNPEDFESRGVGLSQSHLSRILAGKIAPSFLQLQVIIEALQRFLIAAKLKPLTENEIRRCFHLAGLVSWQEVAEARQVTASRIREASELFPDLFKPKKRRGTITEPVLDGEISQ